MQPGRTRAAGHVVRGDAVVADDCAEAGIDVHADAVVVHAVLADVGALGVDAHTDAVAGDVVVVDHGGCDIVDAEPDVARCGRADDVAAAAIFFATAPNFITGQLLAVDGGLGL